MPRRLIFDIEGNGLLDTVTKVHCIAAVDPDTGERLDWKPHQLQDAYAALASADELWAHYGIGYDYPALAKVARLVISGIRQRDTVVTARLMLPDIKNSDRKLVERGTLPGPLAGKHSLKAWGYRLGNHKGDYEGGWDEWSQEMHDYMLQDVETTMALWQHLKVDTYSQRAIELEHRTAILVRRMEQWGCPFDAVGAGKLQAQLVQRQHVLRKELVEEFGTWFEPQRKNGEIVEFTPRVNNKRLGYEKGQTMVKLELVTFNPGSRQHAIKKLKELGWKPTEYTKGGEAQLTDEILESISSRFPQATKLVEYLLIEKRLGMISDGKNAWLVKVQADGMMRGSMNPMGTPHGRASHFGPNMAQVPAPKSPYGKECRELFGADVPGAPEGFVQVGADMAGLQLRALGHYLAPIDGGSYGQLVTTSDPHWAHTKALGLVADDEVRDEHNALHEVLREVGGKRFGYAYIFGCRENMAGSIVRDCCTTARTKNPEWGYLYDQFFGEGQTNRQVGEVVRATFDAKLRLGELQRRLANHLNNSRSGWPNHIPGLDGRWVPCRNQNSALNYLLSSAEAILCKTWICDAYDELVSRGLRPGWDGDFVFMLWVHDELQAAARKGLEEEVGQVLRDCAKKAGEKLQFRVPIASKYKTGRSWADCH